MRKKINNIIVSSLCAVLLVSALILSFNVFSDFILVARQDDVCGEIVSEKTKDFARQDDVCGEIVSEETKDFARQDDVCGEIVSIETYDFAGKDLVGGGLV